MINKHNTTVVNHIITNTVNNTKKNNIRENDSEEEIDKNRKRKLSADEDNLTNEQINNLHIPHENEG